MAIDPYVNKLFTGNPYYAKSDLHGKLVVVLQTEVDKRGLQLIPQASRCICTNQVHELICTDEKNVKPGGSVDRIAYVGFVAITEGGVIIAGDEVYYDDRLIGHIAGFDETHMPNHYNIILSVDERISGRDLGLIPGGRIRIHKPD